MTAAANTTEAAARSIRRAAACARVSGVSLVVLGGISLVFAITNPLSAGFLVSVAVLANGLVEWRYARRLAALDPRAPGVLAINQLLLGLAIAVYSAWQVFTLDPAALGALLTRPPIKDLLQLFDPAFLELLITVFPETVRFLYAVVGAVALLGCAATAWYYSGRRRPLTALLSAPPPFR